LARWRSGGTGRRRASGAEQRALLGLLLVGGSRSFLVHGVTSRRPSAMMHDSLRWYPLSRRCRAAFGYGTLQAGRLEIACVLDPKHVRDLVERFAA